MRLDNYLVEKGFFDSRTKAKQAIERGEIYLNGKPSFKPSYEVNIINDVDVKRICQDSFVSLGGFKLKKAFEDFNFNPNNLICADVGASTGGFTDCLIQSGAKKVYAIDLNDELLHPTLKDKQNVVSIIKNVKNLSLLDFDEKLDLVVADLSFISITQVMPILSSILDDGKKLIILIKPQFETGEKRRFKNGIIRDKKVQLEACYNAYDCAILNSLSPIAFTTAPIKENKNVEFLMLFSKNTEKLLSRESINF